MVRISKESVSTVVEFHKSTTVENVSHSKSHESIVSKKEEVNIVSSLPNDKDC